MSDIPRVPRSGSDAGAPPPAPTPESDDDAAAGAVNEEYRFPCPTCGSDMRFSPDTGNLVCDHCGHVEPISAIGRASWTSALQELDYQAALRQEVPAAQIVSVRTLNCQSCGAQIEFADGEQAKECPFCASPVVVDSGVHRQLKPQAVLPFALDERTAHAAMTKWLGRLWFAPNGLQQYARKGRRMNGMYVPYWTYDADTRTRYSGRRGDDYWTTETRMVDGKPRTTQVRRTRWRSVSGQVARDFDDVLVLASDSLPRDYTDALEPWDLGDLKPFLPEYLAGFGAEGYSVELEPGFAIARRKMDAVIASDIRRDIGGDHQQITGARTDIGNVTFKHILLPIWVAAYRYSGKSYRFVVNARTGEVRGERPYSAWKIALAVVAAVFTAAAFLYLNNMQGG
ncbi:TFIIB-type zinc finger domain-containing protein [Tropicimonas sp.]|uniref:TFIIB-type zinc finger domain-containing protein n=1 Tax=Tropicimonas sp. TaxID=2067044 RepID=UPI003A8B7706